ncbi:hypothetical protein [Isoptericola sp. NPDC060257]|uniref:hypothetical protein n=1 Tax=Isoptericola sp. NPDC060257 TaxID=3347087 RepID=UPI00364B48C7
MTRGLPPEETVDVVGGRALSEVDAEAVQGAAVLLDGVAEGLRRASHRCLGVAGTLRGAAWAPDPWSRPAVPLPGATGDDAAVAAYREAAAARLDEVSARLRARTSTAEGCSRRLRLAAGLYREAESVVQRVADGAVTLLAGAAGAWLGLAATPVLTVTSVADGLRGARARGGSFGSGSTGSESTGSGATVSPPTASSPPDPPTVPVTTGPDGSLASVWRVVAPFSDEAVGGFAAGFSATRPLTWQDLRRGIEEGPAAALDPVTRGAGSLSDVVAALLPDSVPQVVALADADLAGPRPGWADRPAGSVVEALARTADLYPQGSGVVDRPAAGVPAGTLAVEEVVHGDGTTSWTVLIPGTQELLSPTNPFDAATDLSLMAHEAADVSVAVEQALDAAGAAADEPVVLVGHSLGGIAASALAASPAFRANHPVGGVVTAGAPTASFALPAGVPVLHVENEESLVENLDGRSREEGPAAADRVTVGRRLLDSTDPADVAAAGSISLAHAMPTHLRTLAAAQRSGNVQVAGATGRLEQLLDGTRARTRFFAARRVDPAPPLVLAPGPGPGPVPGPGSTVLGTTSPPPGNPTGAMLH